MENAVTAHRTDVLMSLASLRTSDRIWVLQQLAWKSSEMALHIANIGQVATQGHLEASQVRTAELRNAVTVALSANPRSKSSKQEGLRHALRTLLHVETQEDLRGVCPVDWDYLSPGLPGIEETDS